MRNQSCVMRSWNNPKLSPWIRVCPSGSLGVGCFGGGGGPVGCWGHWIVLEKEWIGLLGGKNMLTLFGERTH